MMSISMQNRLNGHYKRSLKSIASGTQTYSKQPCRFVEGVYPEYAHSGKGCMLYSSDGTAYVDYICGLGTNILGYAHPRVNEVVKAQIDRGTLFSLPNTREIFLAEKIKSMIPSMELVRFLKSGSEAVSAGIKIARAYTGRDMILSNGYHGWHDWSTPITSNNLGTPEALRAHIEPFEYDDLVELEQLFSLFSGQVACVVLDPFIFDEPHPEYFQKLIKLAHKNGALVLFDEVVTGIRWSKYAVQNAYGVRPDLTALGKATANGFAMSCIGGKKSIMRVLDKGCFVSSTYGGDLVGISAALATLDVVTSESVPDRLYETGAMLMGGLKDIGIDCQGSPFRQRLAFVNDITKALFWQECVKRGILFGGAQHTSLAHTEFVIEKTLDIAREAWKTCKLYEDNPKRGLLGKVPQAVSTISDLRKKHG